MGTTWWKGFLEQGTAQSMTRLAMLGYLLMAVALVMSCIVLAFVGGASADGRIEKLTYLLVGLVGGTWTSARERSGKLTGALDGGSGTAPASPRATKALPAMVVDDEDGVRYTPTRARDL